MEKSLQDIFGNFTGLDQKSIEFLTKALSKANLPGFDYLEFKQSLSKLIGMGMDETTAIKSAFATASTIGLTKEKLLQTAIHYREVLGNEKEQFDVALNNTLQRRVRTKQEEVKKLQGQIGKWQAQIEKLKKQISQSQETIDNADEAIKSEMNKIESTKDNFEHTYVSILNQINKDIENLKLNL